MREIVELELPNPCLRCAELKRERDEARRAASRHHESEWLWTRDGDNDLESMSDDMVVTMTARTLRSLLEKAKQGASGSRTDRMAISPCATCARPTANRTMDNGGRCTICSNQAFRNSTKLCKRCQIRYPKGDLTIADDFCQGCCMTVHGAARLTLSGQGTG